MASEKCGSVGNVEGSDMLSNTKKNMMTTTMPKRSLGKDGGDGLKTVDDAQKRDEDGLVASVDDVVHGGDNTEQVVSPLFVLYAIIQIERFH